jgi:hypothetical protein
MNEIKARGYEGGASGGGSKRREAIRKAVAPFKGRRAFNGVLTLSPKAFARFEECMKNPGEPTPANKRGAQLLRTLYKSR